MTRRFILALVLCCSPLWATTYYVDDCVTVGSDLNKGTSTSTPWLTINKVNTSKFNPGDSILFQSTCTWREQLTVPSSGTAGSPITFGAYGTGEQPIISGANLFTSWTPSSGSVYYTSYSTAPNQVFEDGNRLTQNTTSSASLTAGQWYLDTVHSRIWVHTTAGDSPSGHTMEASQRTDAANLNGQSYIAFSGLQFKGAKADGLFDYSAETGLTLTNDTFTLNFDRGFNLSPTSSGAVTITAAGNNSTWNGSSGGRISLDVPATGSTFTIKGNTFNYNGQMASINSGDWIWMAGFYIYCNAAVGYPLNVTITSNQSNYNGVGISPTVQGIWSDTCNGVTLAYNETIGNTGPGIMLEKNINSSAYSNVSANNASQSCVDEYYSCEGGNFLLRTGEGFPSSGVTFANNTSYGGQQGMVCDNFGPQSSQGPASAITNSTWQNNIAIGSSLQNFYVGYGCDNDGTNGSGNIYTFNSFGTPFANFLDWGNNVYFSSYSAWEMAAGNCGTVGCSHSVQSNPQFVNAATSQFWLASGSPAIDTGTDLGSPYNLALMPGSSWPNSVLTGEQNASGTGWEIGAFLYVPPVTPPPSLRVVKVN